MSTIIRAVRPPEESARAYSYRVLVMYICEMFFLPGERLVEADIAAQLGVSRTPVHDTFLQLIHEKMLCTGPRSVYVPLLDPENIRQSVWMLRTTGLAVLDRLFTMHLSTDAFEPLEHLVVEEYEMLSRGALSGAAKLITQFHQQLFALADYPLAFQALGRASADLYRLHRLNEDRAVLGRIVGAHAALVQALGTRRHEDACMALMREHDEMEPILQACRQRRPQYFV